MKKRELLKYIDKLETQVLDYQLILEGDYRNEKSYVNACFNQRQIIKELEDKVISLEIEKRMIMDAYNNVRTELDLSRINTGNKFM